MPSTGPPSATSLARSLTLFKPTSAMHHGADRASGQESRQVGRVHSCLPQCVVGWESERVLGVLSELGRNASRQGAQ
jgi:hypothetical protein